MARRRHRAVLHAELQRRYPETALKWKDWFPAELVTECFPGQFRNWFYSLLSLATMMGYEEGEETREEREEPAGSNDSSSLALSSRLSSLGSLKRPFKTSSATAS